MFNFFVNRNRNRNQYITRHGTGESARVIDHLQRRSGGYKIICRICQNRTSQDEKGLRGDVQ